MMKNRRGPPPDWLTNVTVLTRNVLLIYGKELAFDRKERQILRLASLRLAYGTKAVSVWLEAPERETIKLADLPDDLRRIAESEAGPEEDKSAVSQQAYAAELEAELLRRAGHRPVFAEGVVWTVRDNLWSKIDDRALRNLAAEMFHGAKHATTQRDFAQIVQRLQDRIFDPEFFAAAPFGVTTDQSFYYVQAGELVRVDRDPNQRQRFALACEPTFSAEGEPGHAPQFDAFLLQTFSGDDWAEQIGLVQEIIGAALVGLLAQFQLAVLFVGVTRAGKGVLTSIFEKLFPPDVTTSVSPAAWGHEYHRAALAGKRANIVGEVDAKRPIPAGDFKSVTGRDKVGARAPTHAPFAFRNEAAHIFSGNTFPPTTERDAAFYGRWRIVHFRNSIAGREDPALADRIVGKEMSEIVAWALVGAKRAAARKALPVTKAHRERLETWKTEHSSALSFLRDDEWIELDEAGYEPRRRVFEIYLSWCRAEGRHYMGSKSFYEEIRAHAGAWGVAEGRDAVGVRVFRGLRLVPRA